MRKIIRTVKVPAAALGNGFNVKSWDVSLGPGALDRIIDAWAMKGFILINATPVGGSRGMTKEYLLTFEKDLRRYSGMPGQQRLM